jgi:hypothetical protein
MIAASSAKDNQMWGINHTDREYTRIMGDRLRIAIEMPTRLNAEQLAAQLGFSEPWAHPLSATEQAAWLAQMRAEHPQILERPHKERSYDMRTPTTAQLRTAIEVLKSLDQRLNEAASHSTMQLPDSKLGGRYADRIESQTIEQTARIKLVSAQLENWHEEITQQRRQCVSHHV